MLIQSLLYIACKIFHSCVIVIQNNVFPFSTLNKRLNKEKFKDTKKGNQKPYIEEG